MKRRYFAGILAGLMMLSAVGCGASSKNAATTEMSAMDMAEAPQAEEWIAEEAAAEYEAGAGAITSENGIEAVKTDSRKLIKTVYLEMQTKEFDSVLDGLTKKVAEMEGYIESSSISGNSYYYESTRSAYYTVRVPSDRLDEFVEVVGGLGNVTHKNESVEDVTLQYVDTESRKKALETEQERLLELLGQAENMEDLLAIESKLSEVRYELENYGSQLRMLDNRIDYCTVNVDIIEVERFTEVKERTFFEEVSDRFGDSLYTVGRGLRGFTVGFLGSLPILAVWAVIIVIIVLVVKRVTKGRGEKKKSRKKEISDNPPSGPEV